MASIKNPWGRCLLTDGGGPKRSESRLVRQTGSFIRKSERSFLSSEIIYLSNRMPRGLTSEPPTSFHCRIHPQGVGARQPSTARFDAPFRSRQENGGFPIRPYHTVRIGRSFSICIRTCPSPSGRAPVIRDSLSVDSIPSPCQAVALSQVSVCKLFPSW